MSDNVMYALPLCPACKSFQVETEIGDVKGKSCLDAWVALDEPKPYPQEFITRSYHVDRCRSCGHKWGYKEHDGVRLCLEARKPTLVERVKGWFE